MSSRSLDHFRALLDHLDEGERAHQNLFFRLLGQTGPEAVEELAPRVQRAIAPPALRQLAMEGAFYYRWPEWIPLLTRLLRHESNLDYFATGVRALARIGGGDALATLRELSGLRATPGFQEVLAEALAQTDPAEAFRYHLGRLLAGSSNPAAANAAAQQLQPLLAPECLEPLKVAVMHPDLLVFRQALRLLCHLDTPEATDFLKEFLGECHLELLDDRELKEAIGALRGLAPSAAREEAMKRLEALAEAEGHASAGYLEAFLNEALQVALDGKAVRLQALLNEAAEALHLRARRLSFGVDTCAEGLAERVQAGGLGLDTLLPLLRASFTRQTGREGVARALATVLKAEDAEGLTQLLQAPDSAMRGAAVEALGRREEEALRPVLLQACRDPIEDVAMRAMTDIGRLPGLEDLARGLLSGPALEDIRLGLRLVALHRLPSLAPELLELVKNTAREELALDALTALGAAAPPEAVPTLLDMLHTGQSPRMQVVLAEALRDMGNTEAALGLSARAPELKSGLIHTLCIEALARAFGRPERTLEAAEGARVMGHLRAAWRDKDPWPLRYRCILALQSLQLPSPPAWQDIHRLVQDALAEKRAPGAWSVEELASVQAVARDLAQRAGG